MLRDHVISSTSFPLLLSFFTAVKLLTQTHNYLIEYQIHCIYWLGFDVDGGRGSSGGKYFVFSIKINKIISSFSDGIEIEVSDHNLT